MENIATKMIIKKAKILNSPESKFNFSADGI